MACASAAFHNASPCLLLVCMGLTRPVLPQALGQTFDVGDIPADLKEQADEYHEMLVEAAVSLDDDAMEAYLEGVVRSLFALCCLRVCTHARHLRQLVGPVPASAKHQKSRG